MTRELVTVRTISDIQPIEGADRIELAIVDGWQCVVNKGEFKIGDKGVYFEIDSFLPASNPAFGFLEKNFTTWRGHHGVRIRTIKLKKQISQGLLLPLFPAFHFLSTRPDADLAFELKVLKWERGEVVEGAPRRPKKKGLKAWVYKVAKKARYTTLAPIFLWLEGRFPEWFKIAPEGFPDFIPKTDQERIQNIFNRVKREDDSLGNAFTWEKSIKLDGSSMTIFHNKGRSGVCSRNLELDIRDGGNFVNTAKSTGWYDALDKMKMNVAVQGELMGPGIQQNREGLKTFNFYVYDVYDIDAKRYLTPGGRIEFMSTMAKLGVQTQHVPILDSHFNMSSVNSVADLLELAEGPSINAQKREGLVFKRSDGIRSFKVISNSYLLKHGD